MEYQELKQQSNEKILLRGKSGRGKTRGSSIIALEVSDGGADVLYLDTEAEGSNTMVRLIEQGEYDEDAVRNLTYVPVSSYEQLMEHIDLENQGNYDLLIVDTLDHKHSFALKKVTDSDLASDADWNQYPTIYSYEKQIMEKLSKPRCNILCTLDPDSGKIDKPKGAQTNIHGYFSIVLDLNKQDDGWGNRVRNFIGRSDVIGNQISSWEQSLSDEILERTD